MKDQCKSCAKWRRCKDRSRGVACAEYRGDKSERKSKKARQEAGMSLSKEDKEQLIADLRQLSKSVTFVCCTLIGILKDFCDEYPEQ